MNKRTEIERLLINRVLAKYEVSPEKLAARKARRSKPLV